MGSICLPVFNVSRDNLAQCLYQREAGNQGYFLLFLKKEHIYLSVSRVSQGLLVFQEQNEKLGNELQTVETLNQKVSIFVVHFFLRTVEHGRNFLMCWDTTCMHFQRD